MGLFRSVRLRVMVEKKKTTMNQIDKDKLVACAIHDLRSTQFIVFFFIRGAFNNSRASRPPLLCILFFICFRELGLFFVFKMTLPSTPVSGNFMVCIFTNAAVFNTKGVSLQ